MTFNHDFPCSLIPTSQSVNPLQLILCSLLLACTHWASSGVDSAGWLVWSSSHTSRTWWRQERKLRPGSCSRGGDGFCLILPNQNRHSKVASDFTGSRGLIGGYFQGLDAYDGTRPVWFRTEESVNRQGEGDFSREACPAVALITVSSNR